MTTAEGAFIESERLVLATPAAATATLLAPHAPAAAAALRAIPHAPGRRRLRRLSIVRPTCGIDLDAYGFVVARGEGVRLLGCQYETSVFSGRAPEGGVLLRALLGGTFDPGLVDADDGAIAAQARRRSAARRPASPAIPTSSTSGAHAPEFHNTTSRTPTASAPSTTPSRGCPGSP